MEANRKQIRVELTASQPGDTGFEVTTSKPGWNLTTLANPSGTKFKKTGINLTPNKPEWKWPQAMNGDGTNS